MALMDLKPDDVKDILSLHKGHKRANYIITCPCRHVKGTRIRLDKDLLRYACDMCKANVLAYKLQYDKPVQKPHIPLVADTLQAGSTAVRCATNKEQIEKMIGDLMQEHGLTQDGWRFMWDHATSRAGVCKYDQQTICLSKHLLQKTAEDIRNIALHEIAHAMTPGHGHDDLWRQVAQRIGCDGKRCHSLGPLGKPKYKLSCPCGAVKATRFRIDQAMFHKVCKACKKPVLVAKLAS